MRLRRRRLPVIEVLRLQPGDTLIVHVDRDITRAEADQLVTKIKQKVPGYDVLALARPLTLGVVRQPGGAIPGPNSPLPTSFFG